MFFTSLHLKKPRSSIGADHGSGSTRPMVARTPPPFIPLPVLHQVKMFPPGEMSPPTDMSPLHRSYHPLWLVTNHGCCQPPHRHVTPTQMFSPSTDVCHPSPLTCHPMDVVSPPRMSSLSHGCHSPPRCTAMVAARYLGLWAKTLVFSAWFTHRDIHVA